jgi:ferritin-like metal-binding protein YciE
MFMNADLTPPRDPDIDQSLAGLLEKLVDVDGNAALAARLEAAITEASALIARVEKVLASADFARELTACRAGMEKILAAAKIHTESTAKFQREWARRLKIARDNEITI